jgi:hypothetical protein
VFTVEGDRVRLRWIRLGRDMADAVEVLAGPGQAMTVVRSPSSDVVDGAPISAAEVVAWSAAGDDR